MDELSVLQKYIKPDQVKPCFLFKASERGEDLAVIILDIFFYEFTKAEIAVGNLFFDLKGEHLVDVLVHTGILQSGLQFTIYGLR